ncbi:MAG: [FeFe] hydrogenase H-cluster maturation GTPase HydF [Ignavibacteriaceae bacterium]|nr:[FeFe] hydrogenase H-cluster maturation GTPase HydF [Ignavibacteriaceae bacterium]
MIKAGETEKLHIAIIGRKNVGKSLLINRIVSQELFTVNDIPGTTTEPMGKAVELLPYGPVVIVDTAGIDDDEFGMRKISKTIKAISYADFAILVLDAREELDKSETDLITFLRKIQVPFLVAVNKIEFGINPHLLIELEALEVTHFEVSCKENAGIENFKKKLIHLLPGEKETPMFEDIVRQGDVVLMVVPNNFDDLQGRVFKSQVQKIQEELGEDIVGIVVKENELAGTLKKLKHVPDLVIADNQTISKVVDNIPESVKLTTYSLVMTRQQGNLSEFVKGIKRVKELENGDKVLISEGCENHLQEFEIGKMKIQEWIKLYSKKKLQIDFSNGCGFPDNLPDYKLIIHCDGCSITRKIMQSRIRQVKLMDIPIVNYSVMISYLNGAIPRTLFPFKEAVSVWQKMYN